MIAGQVRSRPRSPPRLAGSLAVLAAFVVLTAAERARPLRTPGKDDQARRTARNLALAGLSAAATQLAERPVVVPLARLVERRRWGLLPRLSLPPWMEQPAACLLMDYSLYLWHRLTHRVPLLWRFHQVHHADLDMDATTAIRFHAGEFVLGIPYRAAQVALIGVNPGALTAWQRMTLAEVLFHHSNLRLPLALERWLVRVVVTPGMHGIHHSTAPGEREANWSSGLSVWDRLHGTLKLRAAREAVEIGLPEYRRPDEVRLPRLLAMPFARRRRAARPLDHRRLLG